MREIIFNTNDGQKLACTIWDKVKNPVGAVQIIHGIDEPIRQYDRFAKFLNKNRYIVFGVQNHIVDAPPRQSKSDTYSDVFMATVNNEIQILEYLTSKYKLPVFLFGHGFGSFITQRVMECSDLCAAGVCLSGGMQFPTWFLRIGAFLSWIGIKVHGVNAPAKFLEHFSPVHGTTNDAQYFTYGFFYSLFHNLIQITYNVDCHMPILIISGGANLGSQNASLANALYKTYQAHNMQNLTIIIYPDVRHELLMTDVQRDVLDFFNSIQYPQNED